MAEILGVVGSAISILQLVEQTIQTINRVRHVRNFMGTISDELEKFLDDIEIVQAVLLALRPDMVKLRVLSLPLIERRLQRFQVDLTVLASVIQNQRDRVGNRRAKFKLFLKKDRLQKQRESLENIRHTLNTLLLLQQTYNSAHVRDLRLIEDKTGISTATLQASSDCQEQEYNSRRPKDLQNIGPRKTRGTKVFSFRTPLLFVDRFWNINITGITSGWNFSIRSYSVISSAIIRHCIDGNIEEIQRLFDNHHASPFDCTDDGRTLLHIAAAYGQLEVCKFLLQNGADPPVRESSGRTPLESGNIGYDLYVDKPRNLHGTLELYRLLLRDNEDVILEKPNSTWVGEFWFQGPPEALTLIQESLFVDYYSLPIEFRFRRAMSLKSWSSGGPSPEMFRIAMGSDSIDPAAYHLTDEYGHTLLFEIAELMSVDIANSREDDLSGWRELIREAIQAGADLCHISSGIYYTPLAVFLFFQGMNLRKIKRAIYKINHILQRWALELQSAGVDLAVYGSKESALWKSGAVDPFFYDDLRLSDQVRSGELLKVHLFSLSYGPSPEDWHVWVANPVDELVGEFWEMIERKEEAMPGAWVE
ncbi:hypothetical protein CNMCM6106_008463 [Aspergillus hiratsukae]|uniref:Uncharacterized protein n=1 Tax=Aspergillus hiratsukae TaxID=1194566 RepID=A0A8H6V559_9EURO|nr:hypothetical protein CNMCM6106_008463 [Aspergillus hiratsukae]